MKPISRSKVNGGATIVLLIRKETSLLFISAKPVTQAATTFFKKAISTHGLPEKVIIDKSGANRAGLEYLNMLFLISGYFLFLGIEFIDVKYLSNIALQSHRFIKQKMVPTLGCKSKAGAEAARVEKKHGR